MNRGGEPAKIGLLKLTVPCYVMPELGHVPIAAVTPAQLEHLIAALATDRNRRAGDTLMAAAAPDNASTVDGLLATSAHG